MLSEDDLPDVLKAILSKKEDTSIVYKLNNGVVKINNHEHKIVRLSYTQLGDLVKNSLKELYGEYETIPHTFNSEAYENDSFKAEVLAIAGLDILEFNVYKKE